MDSRDYSHANLEVLFLSLIAKGGHNLGLFELNLIEEPHMLKLANQLLLLAALVFFPQV